MFVLNLDKLHSYVDIITNSSTVIYTWSEGSIDKAKELLQAMFELFGETDVDVEEEFYFNVFPDEIESLNRELLFKKGYKLARERPENMWADENEDARKKYFSEFNLIYDDLKNKFLTNDPETPDWYKELVEESLLETDGFYMRKDNNLIITPKNNKYQHVVDKMIAFLYSTQHDGVRNA